MPKTNTKTAPATSVPIRYDLFDLPTAQHKAGLAGLLLQIQSMRDRHCPQKAIPVVEETTPSAATVRFTADSLQGLFDDLYDARIVEVAVKSKWPGGKLKREEEFEETDDDGTTRKSKRFIYDVVQPCGHFLRQHLPAMDLGRDWLKLWREMLWAIPRGIPKTRIPFENRAAGKPCKEGIDAWEALLKVEQARQQNGFFTQEVSSALWLGAQATNAEGIPFRGRAEQNLLLHFWPLTALVFVPQQIDADGKGDFAGYVLAIPEVADLESFLADYPPMLSQLGTEVAGFRPAEAIIDLPAEGALAFLEHLARLVQHRATGKAIRYSVASVEYLHLEKKGNTIKSMAAGRIAPRPDLLERYLAIVGRPGVPPPFRNPLFRRGLMLALLNAHEWYADFATMLADRPWPFFIRRERTPRVLPWFATDAARQFHFESENHETLFRSHQEMAKINRETAGPAPQAPLPVLIHQLIARYVLRKTEDRTGKKWEEIKERKTQEGKIDVPQDWREAREKVASDAFLGVRSRREQDFVDFFTATFCSVRQYLPEADYCAVAQALLDHPENVKTLTMLALSANS